MESQRFEQSGKYLAIFQQGAAGAWKYYNSIWNNDR
jgi:hypothetical protein